MDNSIIEKSVLQDAYALHIRIFPQFIVAETIKKIWEILIGNSDIIKPKKGEVWVLFNLAYDHIHIEHTYKNVLERLHSQIEPVIEQEKTDGPTMSSKERYDWFNATQHVYRGLNHDGIELVWGEIELDALYNSLASKTLYSRDRARPN